MAHEVSVNSGWAQDHLRMVHRYSLYTVTLNNRSLGHRCQHFKSQLKCSAWAPSASSLLKLQPPIYYVYVYKSLRRPSIPPTSKKKQKERAGMWWVNGKREEGCKSGRGWKGWGWMLEATWETAGEKDKNSEYWLMPCAPHGRDLLIFTFGEYIRDSLFFSSKIYVSLALSLGSKTHTSWTDYVTW